MKTLMTALLLIAVTAQWNTASAQYDQMRLWSPPRSDQFGGYGHLREGVFGEIDYNYWTITKGKDTTIGWVSPSGVQNLYFNGTAFLPRTNSMSTSSLGNNFTGGVTLRIGNMIKHHGWEIKSTIMLPQKDTFLGRSGSMDISDDPYSSTVFVPPQQAFQTWYFTGDPNRRFEMIDPLAGVGPGGTPNIQSGYLWGWFFVGANGGGYPMNDMDFYGLAPLPITFDRYKLESKISHWDVEANYIFRAHATRIGFFEFTGGVRYMQLDDNLGFKGWGMPWKGNIRIETDGAYAGENTPDTMPGNTTGGTTGNNTNATAAIDITEYYLENGELPGLDRNYTYVGDLRGPGTVLADSVWDFKAQNHLVGPQVGIRYITKCSGRWSLIADTKFFAGFNTQNIKSDGIMGGRPAGIDIDALGRISVGNGGAEDDVYIGAGNVPWVPVGTMQSPGTFHHSQTRTAFSPGIDLGLKANWQFTDAIAFNVGYQGMYLDKTARASLINSYQIAADGTIFGINEKVTQSTFMHGVSFGMTINRF